MPRFHHHAPVLAALLAIALYSVMDAAMKGASLAIGAYGALLWRGCLAMLIVVPLWLMLRQGWPDRAAVRLHLLRGLVAALMSFSFFWGLERLPMAEAIAISFIAPLITLYLAAVMLGEAIAGRAIVASIMGLAGVLVIASGRIGAQAAGDEAGWGIGAILLSAVLYAWNLILQRRQSLIAQPLEVAVFMNVVLVAALLPAAPFMAAWPTSGEVWAMIAASAVLTVGAMMLLSWAYARAEAQVLAPLEYSAFVGAAILGWLVYSEPLSALTLAGSAMIILGCWIGAPRKRSEQTAL